jgi:predicted  nucleic acid-binding Zn-ribbon protein
VSEPENEGGAPGRQFGVLLEVQDLDTALGQLHHRRDVLPERLALRAAEQERAQVVAAHDSVSARRQELGGRLAELEAQATAFSGRHKSLEDHMYADRGAASRDLQAMSAEARHLTDRQREVEDQELELMEELEPVDAELAGLDARRAELEQASLGLRSALVDAEAAIDAEVAALEPARAAAAANLPPDLAELYERIRSHLKGTGAARLIGHHCDGCHLELSPVEVDRILRLPADDVVTCESCGRILVRTAASGA